MRGRGGSTLGRMLGEGAAVLRARLQGEKEEEQGYREVLRRASNPVTLDVELEADRRDYDIAGGRRDAKRWGRAGAHSRTGRRP